MVKFFKNSFIFDLFVSKSLKYFCLLCLSFLLMACDNKPEIAINNEVANVKTITLKPYIANRTRELIGRVEHTNTAPLAFEVSGKLVNIAVRDGEIVKKGALIAQLDKEPYALAVSKASSQYNQLANDLVRSRKLRNERILPQATFEQLEAQTNIAQSKLALAERDLRNTELLAPFDGRIASRRVELWQSVQAGTPAFNLENLHQADISVDIPQRMLQTIKLDKDLKAIGWLPERPNIEFDLQYKEHTTQGTAGAGIFRLIFEAKTPDDIDLLAGMSVRVRIITSINPINKVVDLWEIPVNALSVTPTGQYFIWRLADEIGTAQRVDVAVIEIQQDSAIIKAPDLVVGQHVVTTGQHFVHEGQKLNLIGTSQ